MIIICLHRNFPFLFAWVPLKYVYPGQIVGSRHWRVGFWFIRRPGRDV